MPAKCKKLIFILSVGLSASKATTATTIETMNAQQSGIEKKIEMELQDEGECSKATIKMSGLKEYKCRVECPIDIERMRAKLKVGKGVIVGDDWGGGEWVFKDRRTLKTIRKLIGECVDCHVAEQTVQPIADYTGVRVYRG